VRRHGQQEERGNSEKKESHAAGEAEEVFI